MMNFTFLNFFGINKNKAWQQLLVLVFLLFGFVEINASPTKENLYRLNDQPYKVISFGETIFFGNIEYASKWTVINTQGGMITNLSGNQINDYIFDKPGIYEIFFSENKKLIENECNHPQFNEKMIVEVSSLKMTFDFSKIKFSKVIVGGKELQNVEVSVAVDFKSYNNEKAIFSNARVTVAGVGANIVGSTPNDKITLTPGIHNIVYLLNGMASKDTYIMFDFFDINGQAQSYYYPSKL
jgi:hypothetical protein